MPHDSSFVGVSASDWSARSFYLAIGGWFFRQRSWLPLPFILLILISPPANSAPEALAIAGVALVICGQFLRLWAVRHIGVISRTRAARLGPLVLTGPYALVRNPLYVGNALLWMGFAMWSRVLWLLPVAIVVFGVQYAFIAQWEEQRLVERFGAAYVCYQRHTPAWIPRWARVLSALGEPARHTWRDVCFSERGTLMAVAGLAVLLVLKPLLSPALMPLLISLF